MPRRRKPGVRTRSGRLSRSYRAPARDTGTAEVQPKRAYLINGSDPQLAASASGILLANGFLTRSPHAAALGYAWAHALTYGRPWRQACPLGDRTGGERPEELLVNAKQRLAEMDAKLTPEQRQRSATLLSSASCRSGFTSIVSSCDRCRRMPPSVLRSCPASTRWRTPSRPRAGAGQARRRRDG
jgi:hypothetical protein